MKIMCEHGFGVDWLCKEPATTQVRFGSRLLWMCKLHTSVTTTD